jgi:hypothetical protein
MRTVLLIGIGILILGIISLFVPIPRTERSGLRAGGMSLAVETQHSEKVSPIVSGILILAGAGMIIAGKRKT